MMSEGERKMGRKNRHSDVRCRRKGEKAKRRALRDSSRQSSKAGLIVLTTVVDDGNNGGACER